MRAQINANSLGSVVIFIIKFSRFRFEPKEWENLIYLRYAFGLFQVR